MQNSAVHANEQPRTGGVLWAAVGSALAYGASAAHPVLALLAALSPFPLLLVRLRSGQAAALLGVGSASALVLALFSVGHALAYLLFLAVPVLVMGESVARGRGMVRGCAWGLAVASVPILGVLLFANPQAQRAAFAGIEHLRSPAFLEDMRTGGMPSEQLEAWTEQVAAAHRIMAVVYPAVSVIMGALVVLANASLLRIYLRRRDPGWLEPSEFENVRFPLATAVVFVLSGLALATDALRPFGYNILLIVGFVFALQGLAVVAFYAMRLAAPALLRTAVFVMVVVNPWAPEMLALIGLFDIWFDFRKWAEPPEPLRG